MKKNSLLFVLFSMLLLSTPFVLRSQDKAKVTITIKNLIAISHDACNGKMDFYAKIHIGGKVKSFPVKEGNNLNNLNWQFTATTDQDLITPLIEVWDDDDAICGGGDDKVCISGNSYRVRKSFITSEYKSESYSSSGTCNDGSEKASITYTITIEPIKTKTQLLTQRSWKQVRIDHSSYVGRVRIWVPTILFPVPPDCKNDDLTIFRRKDIYELIEGASKCSPTDPQLIKSGIWSFQANETKIKIAIRGIPTDRIYSVEKLDENTLILFIANSSGTTATGYTRFTYEH